MLLKQTKIVATISDKRCDVDFIKGLFEAGMNVVRMNTAHLGREGSEMLINNVRAVSNRIAIPVSYTHLRAHETGRNLVCRLLLEKKKKTNVKQ